MTSINPPLETEPKPVHITITITITITIMIIEDPTIITVAIITEDHPQSNQEDNFIREIIIMPQIIEAAEIIIKDPPVKRLLQMLPPL